MSSSDTELDTTADQAGVLKRAYRTVTPSYRGHEDAAMDSIGWVIFFGMVVLLVPLLPFLLILWVGTKLIDAVAGRRGGD